MLTKLTIISKSIILYPESVSLSLLGVSGIVSTLLVDLEVPLVFHCVVLCHREQWPSGIKRRSRNHGIARSRVRILRSVLLG